jgi:hypothetical protein
MLFLLKCHEFTPSGIILLHFLIPFYERGLVVFRRGKPFEKRPLRLFLCICFRWRVVD